MCTFTCFIGNWKIPKREHIYKHLLRSMNKILLGMNTANNFDLLQDYIQIAYWHVYNIQCVIHKHQKMHFQTANMLLIILNTDGAYLRLFVQNVFLILNQKWMCQVECKMRSLHPVDKEYFISQMFLLK
jgi:hypothetical protein